MIEIENTTIDGVKILTPKVFEDARGYFFESYNKKIFNQALRRDINFVQDNQSFSKYGTFRGIHMQNNPFQQGKLIRVVEGKIIDFAIDLRPDSPTYLNYICAEISKENKKQIWIPENMGHAFLCISEYAVVCYKTNNFYDKKSERTIRFDSHKLNLPLAKWVPKKYLKISEKDQAGEEV